MSCLFDPHGYGTSLSLSCLFKPLGYGSGHSVVGVQSENMSFNMSLKRKRRNSFDAGFKLKAIECAEKSNNCQAARAFCVSEKNIRDWRKMKEQVSSMPKTKKAKRGDVPRAPELEQDLAKWVEEERVRGIPVSRLAIRLKAQKMAKQPEYPSTPNFCASAGWCTNL